MPGVSAFGDGIGFGCGVGAGFGVGAGVGFGLGVGSVGPGFGFVGSGFGFGFVVVIPNTTAHEMPRRLRASSPLLSRKIETPNDQFVATASTATQHRRPNVPPARADHGNVIDGRRFG